MAKRTASKTLQSKVRQIVAPWVIGSKFFGRGIDFGGFDRTERSHSVKIEDLLHPTEFAFSDVDAQLLDETSKVLKIVTKASGITMYKVDTRTSEIYMYTRQTIRLDRQKVAWNIDSSKTVAAYVARTKDYVVIDDILEDARFYEGIDYEGSVPVKSVMAVPILTLTGDCFAVVELFRTVFDEPFVNADIKILLMITGWMGAAIYQDWERETLQRHQELNENLLNLITKHFFESYSSSKVMAELVKKANAALGAERGSLFLVDKDKNELVGEYMDDGLEVDAGNVKKVKDRFRKDCGIAGVVTKTGLLLNVKDAYKDDRFNKEIDERTGFITRSILCMPIFSEPNEVIGVCQVINKKDGGTFTLSDECLYNTFAAYFTIAINYKVSLKKKQDWQFINKWYLLMFNFHGNSCNHDKDYIKGIFQDIRYPKGFGSYGYYIERSDREKIPAYCMKMFIDLFGREDINVTGMLDFILSVRKFYIDNVYHNLDHAFHVCHCMYLILRTNYRCFSDIEVKALMIAALCHDLDHPGCTNYNLLIRHDDLSCLYADYSLQKRSYYLTHLIIKHHNIFPKLTPEETDEFFDELKTNMLSMEYSLFYQYENEIRSLLKNDEFDWLNKKHREYLKLITLLSADLADQYKSYPIAKNTALKRFREIYQTNLENNKLKSLCPLTIIYSERQNRIPKYQLKFITYIAVPCVYLLYTLLPNTVKLYYKALIISEDWGKVINDYGKKMWHPHDSFVHKQ